MSYIGRLPVKVPANVSVNISTDKKIVYVEGPLGSKNTTGLLSLIDANNKPFA